MPHDNEDLTALRAEIDAIDDRIQDLLIRRTEVVERVGAQKQQSNTAKVAVRPAREAEIIRRLLGRHRGPFPKPVIVRMWRELLSAQVSLQAPFSVAVFAPRGARCYGALAHDHFGAYTPMTVHESASQVLRAVSDGSAMVGVLPIPEGEEEDPWWRNLMSTADRMPKVVIRLPFAELGVGDGCHAFAVAAIEPEPTGDDITLIAFETMAGISRGRLKEMLADAGLDATWIAVSRSSRDSDAWLHFVSAPTFVGPTDQRLASVTAGSADRIARIIPIGAYARPLARTEMGLG